MTKTCTACKVTKDVSEFNKKTANADGYAYRCKMCRRTYRSAGERLVKVISEHKVRPVKVARIPPPPVKTPTNGVCHQKVRRDQTEEEDRAAGHRFDLQPTDFTLAQEKISPEHYAFIERYEWLGKVGWAPKWCFTARHNGALACVVVMSEPTMATRYKQYEALIQRGAAASWAPKNLNSKLVMFSCRWMVNNTPKRLFTCYSDPTAGEIGTIYQACNFLYLGEGWGVKTGHLLPSGKIVSKRDFTKTSAMKRWAKELGITWDKSWCKPNGYQDISAYPVSIRMLLTAKAEQEMSKYPEAEQPSKGKYALILGKDKREEKALKKTIVFTSYSYPKRPP